MKWYTKLAALGAVAAGGMWTVCATAQPPRPAAPPAAPGTGHALTVSVTDVKAKGGTIVVALYATRAGFPDDTTKATRTAKVSPDKPVHTFENVPAGKYAVVVFHDTNDNGKIDKSPLGFPKEPIGLSNHKAIGPKGGRPDFDKAQVSVTRAVAVEVNLITLMP